MEPRGTPLAKNSPGPSLRLSGLYSNTIYSTTLPKRGICAYVTPQFEQYRHTIRESIMSDKKPTLRSAAWFGSADKNGFMYRSWMKNQGIPDHEFQGKPIIGICNTWSELTPCNAHFRKIAEHVKRGILEAGGFPVEFPVFSNGESNLRPTAMLTRNLASMDVEESIRGNPIDAVVLLAGCDKTTPALMMGAASCDVPAIVVSGGPMLNGKLQGRDIGSGTAVWQLHEAM